MCRNPRQRAKRRRRRRLDPGCICTASSSVEVACLRGFARTAVALPSNVEDGADGQFGPKAGLGPAGAGMNGYIVVKRRARRRRGQLEVDGEPSVPSPGTVRYVGCWLTGASSPTKPMAALSGLVSEGCPVS